jgi:glucose/arabinose dehydrogenase
MAMNPWSDTLWLNEHGPRGGMRLISRRREKLRLAAGDARH